MKYDFDTPIERRGTSSAKWDSAEEELIPLWVADMDFPSPREVVEALKRRADHPVFGYTLEPESFYQSVIDWMKRRHGWEIRREWMTYAPGVMPSLNVALLAYSQPGGSGPGGSTPSAAWRQRLPTGTVRAGWRRFWTTCTGTTTTW